MSATRCAQFGCPLSVDDDGSPVHQGKHWSETDLTYCLKRQLDAANECIKQLKAQIAGLRDPETMRTNILRGMVVLPSGYGEVGQLHERIKRLEEAVSKLRDHLLLKVDKCRNCNGSARNHDGEGWIDEECPDCHEDRVALSLFDDKAKEPNP